MSASSTSRRPSICSNSLEGALRSEASHLVSLTTHQIMPIYEATFTIFNVKFSKLASLSNSKKGEVVACLDASTAGSKVNIVFGDVNVPSQRHFSQWNIIPLPGLNRYHIQNDCDQSSYASYKMTKDGKHVIGSSLNRTEWVIKETNNIGNYIISPADDEEVFLGLENGRTDTPVELKYGPPTAYQNQWQFHYHGGPRIVENIIDNLQLTLDWMDMTTTQGPFKARFSGTLSSSDLPNDARISFPKPLRVVWNKLLIGTAIMKATYWAYQVDEHADNVHIRPTSDDEIISHFVRALLREKFISLELHGEEVTVHAGHKDYPGVPVSFRKSITVEGFNYFTNQFIIEKMTFTGSNQRGDSVTTRIDMALKNPSNISVLVDEWPAEIYYENLKIGSLFIPSFKLHHKSIGADFREEINAHLKSANPRDRMCKEFIARYFLTGDSLELSLSFARTVIKLASYRIFIPPFEITCIVNGVNKEFISGCTIYISMIRALFMRKFDYTFIFDNPIEAPVTVKYIKCEGSRKNIVIGTAEQVMEVTAKGNGESTSPKFRDASLCLTLRKMITFVGKQKIKADIDAQRVDVSIDKFDLPGLKFKLKDITVFLKFSL